MTIDRHKLLKRAAFLGIFIFLINLIGMKLHWYSSIWYFDILLHTAGGFFLGLLFFLIFSFKNLKLQNIFLTLLFIFLFGIFWELFEVIFFNKIAQNPFLITDTFFDLFFDLLGGMLSIFYFSKRIMINK